MNMEIGGALNLINGEDRKSNNFNKEHRVFRLGREIVKEKGSYDHVGVKMNIFEDCTSRVEEKISKGRKTLNTSTGLGIRKNGLNMGTSNYIIFLAGSRPDYYLWKQSVVLLRE